MFLCFFIIVIALSPIPWTLCFNPFFRCRSKWANKQSETFEWKKLLLKKFRNYLQFFRVLVFHIYLMVEKFFWLRCFFFPTTTSKIFAKSDIIVHREFLCCGKKRRQWRRKVFISIDVSNEEFLALHFYSVNVNAFNTFCSHHHKYTCEEWITTIRIIIFVRFTFNEFISVPSFLLCYRTTTSSGEWEWLKKIQRMWKSRYDFFRLWVLLVFFVKTFRAYT